VNRDRTRWVHWASRKDLRCGAHPTDAPPIGTGATRRLMPLECDGHRRRAAWSVYLTLVLLVVVALAAVVVL
jgi:hypothetical protein